MKALVIPVGKCGGPAWGLVAGEVGCLELDQALRSSGGPVGGVAAAWLDAEALAASDATALEESDCAFAAALGPGCQGDGLLDLELEPAAVGASKLGDAGGVGGSPRSL